jgi:hypothetical protein
MTGRRGDYLPRLSELRQLLDTAAAEVSRRRGQVRGQELKAGAWQLKHCMPG